MKARKGAQAALDRPLSANEVLPPEQIPFSGRGEASFRFYTRSQKYA